MIGNDIIDIIQTRKESNWQRKGFIEKIYTTSEQLLIAKSANPEIMVWLLWSMKEGAYKIYNRQTKLRGFIPKKLECTVYSEQGNFCFGQVTCFENHYHTKTCLTNDFIHTIAVSSINHLNQTIEMDNRKNIVKNEQGIPYLFSNKFQDVSISHHGRFEKIVTIETLT